MQILTVPIALIWILFFAYWLISALGNRSPFKRRPSRISFLTYSAVPVIVGVFLAGKFAPWILVNRFLPDDIFLAIAGLLITIGGLGFAVWARRNLGKNWSGLPAIHENHTITRTGPYGIVRHPIYTGILVGELGTTLAMGYLSGVLFFFAILAVFLVKIRFEETFLLEEFGEEYARYMREVKALIPFVI